MSRIVVLVVGALMVCGPAFADRLACHDQYAQAYNLSMDAMDDYEKAPQAELAQKDFEVCLNDYEAKNGKQAREALSAKLSALQP